MRAASSKPGEIRKSQSIRSIRGEFFECAILLPMQLLLNSCSWDVLTVKRIRELNAKD